MRASTLDQWEKEVLPYDIGDPRNPCQSFGGGNPQWYDWKNGGRTYVFGLLNAEKYKGMAFDVGFLSQAEEATEDEWEFLAHRITGHAGNWWYKGKRMHQLYADCNPDSNMHFLRERKDCKMIVTTLEDNALHFRNGEWTDFGKQVDKHLQSTLSGIRYRRLYLGEWCSAEGSVFKGFDPDLHVIDELPPDILKWRQYRGIDHGHTAPYVCVWVAHNEQTDEMILWKEDRRCELEVPDRAARVLRYSEDIPKIAFTVADHESLENAVFRSNGVWVEKAIKEDMLKRLDLIRMRLRTNRLKFYRHALVDRCPYLDERRGTRDTIGEMGKYRHKPIEKHIGNSAVDDIPLPGEDHGIDPLGYIVMQVDGKKPVELLSGGIGQLTKENWGL